MGGGEASGRAHLVDERGGARVTGHVHEECGREGLVLLVRLGIGVRVGVQIWGLGWGWG